MGHGPGASARIPAGVVVGAKSILRTAREARPLVRILVAADAPRETTEPVRRLARERSIQLVVVTTSEQLAKHCGITRPVAAAGLLAKAVGTKVPA